MLSNLSRLLCGATRFSTRSVERLWELVSAYLRREEPPNSARLEYPQTHNLPAEAGFSDSTLLIFYQIFQQFPSLLFDLISNPPNNADRYTFDLVEVKETSFRIDGVFLPPNNYGLVYFCEVQFQLDELLYERIVSEVGIYVYRNRARFSDWRVLVIYPTRSIEQSNLGTVREMLTSGRIQRVYLDELGEIGTLPVGLGLMVLTTLEGEEAESEARSAITRAEGDRDIIEMITKIFVYKFNALSRDEVDAMLGIELQQTRVYQEAVAEGEVIGVESCWLI